LDNNFIIRMLYKDSYWSLCISYVLSTFNKDDDADDDDDDDDDTEERATVYQRCEPV